MSFILDALKRAEQQRGAPTRAAASLPRAIATDFEPRARWPWIVGGLAGLVAIVVGLVLWSAREPVPVVVASKPPVATAPAPPAPTPAPAVVTPPPPAAV